MSRNPDHDQIHAAGPSLVVGLDGLWPTVREARWLAHWEPAGVILFSRNASDHGQLSELCAYLHDLLPGCQILVDHEGGPVSPLTVAVGKPPACWGLGRLDDLALTREVHAATGSRLVAAGIDRVLAPCADILVEPRNPVIGARSFGADADLVSRHVSAAVTGLLSAGIGVCLKHWPGHGATGQDSHDTSVTGSEGYLAQPFVAGLQAGADAVMLGHLPDGDDLPATLDPHVTGELRDLGRQHRPGSDLLLLADDVTMGALRRPLTAAGVPSPDGAETGLLDPAELSAAWLTTVLDGGCDWLLCRGIPWRACPLPTDTETGAAANPARTVVQSPRVGGGRSGVGRSSTDVAPAPNSYDVARRRLLTESRFSRRGGDLVWLDLTAGDRWGACGESEEFIRQLSEQYPVVHPVRSPVGSTTLPTSCDRILITSHRPLNDAWRRSPIWATLNAATGYCLVMGHPSLAIDVTELLGERWKISAVYDVDGRDLAPLGA